MIYNIKMKISNTFLGWLIGVFLFGILFASPVAYSAQNPPCPAGQICNPLADRGIDSIPQFIQIALEGVLKVGIPIIALAIIYCGFLFVSAMGKPEALTKAKQALLYTLIGATILLGSWAIAQLISETVTGLKAGM